MRVITASAAILLLLLPVLSQAKTLEDLLAEKGVITRAEANSLSAPSNTPRIFWNDGTRVEFPDNGFSVKVSTFLQTSYTYKDSPKGENDISDFDVPNARIDVTGTALNKEFLYRLEYNGATNHLNEAYLQWNPCDYGYATLGQFKTAISRQFNNTDWKLMFADRSLASDFFSWGYQKGARAAGKLFDGRVETGIAIANGNSDGEGQYASSKDTKHLITGDIRWDAIGEMDPYEEGDINITEDPAFNFGTAYGYSSSNNKINDIEDELKINRIDVDANFKYRGLGMNAEYYVSRENPEINESVTTQGAYVQGGYFVLEKKLEFALRWGIVDCDKGKAYGDCSGMDEVNQATAGLNYYLWKHNLKAQLNYDYLRRKPVDGDALNTNRWLLQLSSYF